MSKTEEIKARMIEKMMKERQKAEEKKEMPKKPIIATDANFEEIVSKYPLVVVDVWAPWCGPCLIVAPVIEELARDYQGKVVFGKMNVDENQGIARKYGIMSIPTLLIFKNGKLVDAPVGAMPREMLEPMIIKHLGSEKYE